MTHRIDPSRKLSRTCLPLLLIGAALSLGPAFRHHGPVPRHHGSALAAAETPAPLRVCATVPDLGSLAREVGGDAVEVTVFVKGGQDPHFMEAKPSFIKALSQADLYIQIGLELEVGWVPNLLQNSRNGQVLRGAPGHLDASTAIQPLDVPAGVIDRAMGDVHPYGNPHYLLDPLNGLKVARAIRDRLVDLRPARKADFDARFESFRKKLGAALVGEKLAAKYDFEKLAVLAERGKLLEFLKSQNDESLFDGWLKRVEPLRGVPVVGDHNMWPYFAQRFGLKVVGFLEPKPGIPPSTKHLSEIVATMKQVGAKAILSVPYFDPRHSRFVSEQTGAKVLRLAHQVGSQDGTDDYLSMVEYNVKQLESVLAGGK
jgi:ABC-type Zn uptake system ZnuABC Zn-binding protein ZnuA